MYIPSSLTTCTFPSARTVVAAASHVVPIEIDDDDNDAAQQQQQQQQHTIPATAGATVAPQLPSETVLPSVSHDVEEASAMMSPPAFPQQLTTADTTMRGDTAAPATATHVATAAATARTPQLPKARRSKLFTPSQERKFRTRTSSICKRFVCIDKLLIILSCLIYFRLASSYLGKADGATTAAYTSHTNCCHGTT